MNSPAIDLGTLPASPQQRRAALLAIASLGALALAAIPFARDVPGTFPGFFTLYSGAVLMGLAITTTILFAQFALSRRPSALVLACGTMFSGFVFVPYILSSPGVGTAAFIGALPNTPAYLWVAWHTALPAAFAAYALITPRDAGRRVGSVRTIVAVIATIAAAYAAIFVVFLLDGSLPRLAEDDTYGLMLDVSTSLMPVLVSAGPVRVFDALYM